VVVLNIERYVVWKNCSKKLRFLNKFYYFFTTSTNQFY
jgi:hypothetical protein